MHKSLKTVVHASLLTGFGEHFWRDFVRKAIRGIDGVELLSVGGVLELVEVAERGFRVGKGVLELLQREEVRWGLG